MASAMAGVPASNFQGSSLGLKSAQMHLADHVAAAHEGGHGVQDLAAAPQHADAGRAEHLVARKGHEINIQRLHVHRHVRHSLARVQQHQRAGLVRRVRQLAHGVDGPQHIGGRSEGE